MSDDILKRKKKTTAPASTGESPLSILKRKVIDDDEFGDNTEPDFVEQSARRDTLKYKKQFQDYKNQGGPVRNGQPVFDLVNSAGDNFAERQFKEDDHVTETVDAHHVANVFSATSNFLLNMRALLDPMGALAIPELQRRRTAIIANWNANSSGAESTKIALTDLANLFTKLNVEQVKTGTSQAIQGVAQLGKQPLLETANQLATGVSEMVTRPFEAIMGQTLTESNPDILSPEERAGRIKGALADGVMLAVTSGTSASVKGGLEGAAFRSASKVAGDAIAKSAVEDVAGKVVEGIATTTTKDLVALANGPKLGSIARRVVGGTVGGSVGGAAQGLVAHANQDDQVSAILMGTIMNVPFGLATEFIGGGWDKLRGKVETPEVMSRVANSLLHERSVKLATDASIEYNANILQSLRTADDVVDAILDARIRTNPSQNHIIPGVTSLEKVNELRQKLSKETRQKLNSDPAFTTATDVLTHDRGDGTYDVAIIGRDNIFSGIQRPIFQSTGFFKGSFASIDGRGVEVVNMSATTGKIVVRDINLRSEPRTVDLSSVRRHNFDTATNIRNSLLETKFNEIYQKFKQAAFGLDAANQQLGDVILRTDVTFDTLVADFAEANGFKPEDVGVVRAELMRRLDADIHPNLPPEEMATITRINNDLVSYEGRKNFQVMASAETLGRKLISNRLYVDTYEGGGFSVRTRAGGKELGVFHRVEDAIQFVDSIGQEKTFDLDGGSAGNHVPPEILGKLPILSDGGRALGTPLEEIWNGRFNPETRVGKLLDAFNTMFPGLTTRPDYFGSVDSKFGTSLYGNIYDKTQQAYIVTKNLLKPIYKQAKVIDNIIKPFSVELRGKLSDFRETMNAEEVVKKLFRNRPLNLQEQQHGKWFFDNKIDLPKVYKFRRWVINENIKYTDLQDAAVNYGLDDIHFEAYTRMQQIIDGKNLGSNSLYAATRYAQALKSGLTRSEYAKIHNISDPRFFKAAELLDQMYDDLAGQFNIEEQRIINGYLNHYRKFGAEAFLKESIGDPLNMPSLEEQFASELIRTGEIDVYEKDPIAALVRYANAGVKSKHLHPVLNEALNQLGNELDKVPLELRDNVKEQTKKYLAELRGKQPQSKLVAASWVHHLKQITGRALTDKQIAEAIEALMPDAPKSEKAAEFRIRKNEALENTKKDLDSMLTNFLAMGESGVQGFMPMAGVRDFTNVATNHYTRFGTVRASRMLALLGDRNAIHKFWESNEAPIFNSLEMHTPGATPDTPNFGTRQVDRAARVADKFVNTSFNVSLQKSAYDNLHAAVYLETFETVPRILQDVSKGKLTKLQAYKKIGLDSYDKGIAEHFDYLISSGEHLEAVKFLSRVTARETVFMFGAANHPAMLATYSGRLLGQFGTWSAWQSRYVGRMAARGSLGSRAARVGRFVAAQSALRLADGLTGYNLSGWMVGPGALMFTGGPAVQAANNMRLALDNNEFIAARAQKDLAKIPWLYFPGYRAGSNIKKGFDLWFRDYNPVVYGLPQAVGLGIDEQNKNWWDDLITIGTGTKAGSNTWLNEVLGESVKPRERPPNEPSVFDGEYSTGWINAADNILNK